MNVIKEIFVTNDDNDTIEKLDQLKLDAMIDSKAQRRYRYMLNKLTGGRGGKYHMITRSGYSSNGERNLVIGE